MSREKGDFAEKRAISFLEDLNFKIIEKNFYAKKLGEIDIIALKDNIYHFCEVKSAPDYDKFKTFKNQKKCRLLFANKKIRCSFLY